MLQSNTHNPERIDFPNAFGDLKKLGHPLFLLSIVLLIANDWFFKSHYGNSITGKLSDFAGLFAFPFLLSVLFPRWKIWIHVATVLLFILWKNEGSDLLIKFINDWGIPVHRIVDVTDLMALVSVIGSYYTLQSNFSVVSERYVLSTILVVSSIAFIATSMPPADIKNYTEINKEYHFEISQRELISRLNAVQLKEIRMLTKVSGGWVDFDADRNIFHYRHRTDTLALLLDYTKISPSDTIVYKSSYAKLTVSGDDRQSTLNLISVSYVRHPGFFSSQDKDFRDKAIRVFEKRVIKKIRKMPSSF